MCRWEPCQGCSGFSPLLDVPVSIWLHYFAPSLLWLPLEGRALEVLGLRVVTALGRGRTMWWGRMEVLRAPPSPWFHHIVKLHIGFYLKNIALKFLFLSHWFKIIEENKTKTLVSILSLIVNILGLSRCVCSPLKQVKSEAKISKIPANTIIVTSFYSKLLASGRIRGKAQIFWIQDSCHYTTCLFKYSKRSENKYGPFVHGEKWRTHWFFKKLFKKKQRVIAHFRNESMIYSWFFSTLGNSGPMNRRI